MISYHVMLYCLTLYYVIVYDVIVQGLHLREGRAAESAGRSVTRVTALDSCPGSGRSRMEDARHSEGTKGGFV